MDKNNNPILSKSAYLLLPVLALAFYVAFIPHQSYPYPVHLDEWIHFANFEALLKAGSTTYPSPLGTGIQSIGPSNLEAGFHIFWSTFHQISGIPWLSIFRFFPGIVLIFTTLAVYVMAQRQGFGWEAALFACLVPTTIGILGPAFIVPVAFGLFFIPLSLFIAFNFNSILSYFVLFIFTCFLLAIHAPSAVCLIIIIFPYILLNLISNFKHGLAVLLAVIIPFLAPFPWIFDMLGPTAQRLLTPQALPDFIDYPMVIKTYGYIPIALCILGTFALAIRGGSRNYGLALGLLALLVMLVTFYTFHYGISILYDRGLMFMLLMVGIVAGAGLTEVTNLRLPKLLADWLKIPFISQHIGKFLSLILVGVILFIGIPDRQGIGYYHMIDEADYQAFVWIKENVSEDANKAILAPWKAAAFTAITGKYAFSWIHTKPKPSDEQARIFLEQDCTDTDFLANNSISIVYTTRSCQNPDLMEVYDNVYLLKETRLLKWVSPTGYEDPDDVWLTQTFAYDKDSKSHAEVWLDANTWSSYLLLSVEPQEFSSLRVLATTYNETSGKVDQIDIDIYYDNYWHDLHRGPFKPGEWLEQSFTPATVSKVRVRFYNSHQTEQGRSYLKEIDFS